MKTTPEQMAQMGINDAMSQTKEQTAAGPVVVTQIAKAKLTLAQVQGKLEGKTGRRFWKNLDELSDDPQFHELMAEEFPRQSTEWVDPISRRGSSRSGDRSCPQACPAPARASAWPLRS